MKLYNVTITSTHEVYAIDEADAIEKAHELSNDVADYIDYEVEEMDDDHHLINYQQALYDAGKGN